MTVQLLKCVAVLLLCVCPAAGKAVEPAEWAASIMAESVVLRSEWAAVFVAAKGQPDELITNTLQKSRACYVGFLKAYKDPKFSRLTEGEEARRLIREQLDVVKALVTHEMICFEIIYAAWKNTEEATLVSAYEAELKERFKMIDQIDFEMGEFNSEVAFLLFNYRGLLRGVEQEPRQLLRFRRNP